MRHRAILVAKIKCGGNWQWLRDAGGFNIHVLEQTLRLPVGSDDTGKYCIFHHRYHIVWSTKYRFKVLTGDVRLRVRGICRQVGREDDVDILHGVLSSNYLHMFLSVPPKHAISYIVRKMKGRSSHKVQREFPNLRKRYWGRRFWGRRYFSTTNGAITEDIVLDYLHKHIQNPTGAGRSVV